jgi:exodeoxyribonuclease VII small subunit
MPKKQVEVSTVAQPDFETALAELETLVQRMEGGELSLEDSLKEFERGVQLTRICQEALKIAEQRVKLLSADGQESDFPQQGEA